MAERLSRKPTRSSEGRAARGESRSDAVQPQCGLCPKTRPSIAPGAILAALQKGDALAALRRLRHVRPLSVLSNASPLRRRFGERLGEALEDGRARHAGRRAVPAAGAEPGRGV